MNRMSFRMVPKMMNPNVCAIYMVLSNGESRQVALIEFPHDSQQNDNLDAAQGICDILRKRVRKSV